MNEEKRKRLEARGWKVGTAAEFLGLTPEDEAWIEMKRALRDKVVELRAERGISQVELAKLIGSRQPRVSRIEAGGEEVGYDLLMKSLLALGATPADIGATLMRASETTGTRETVLKNGKRSGRSRKPVAA